LVESRKKEAFERASTKEVIHLEEYAPILESAYGDAPPKEVLDEHGFPRRPTVGDTVFIDTGEANGCSGVITQDDALSPEPYIITGVGDAGDVQRRCKLDDVTSRACRIRRPAIGDSVIILYGKAAGRTGIITHDDAEADSRPYRVQGVGYDSKWWPDEYLSAPISRQAEQPALHVSKLECKICCSEKPTSEFPGTITRQCNHTRDICKECVSRTIDLEVNGKGNSTRLLCPREGCGACLSHDDVRREATAEVFHRFDELLLQQCLQEDPCFRWCAHSGCGSGQIMATVAIEPGMHF
jgi:ribosomal protein L24